MGDLLAMQQLGRPVAQSGVLQRLLGQAFDVIHFHNVSLMGGPAVLELSRALKLYTMHEHWLVCPMHVLWRMGREPCEVRSCIRCQIAGRRPPQLWRHTTLLERATRAVDLFLGPSRFTIEKHRELGFSGPMHLLPHFIDTPEEAAEGEQPPHPRPYFLFVGRLEPLKGAHVLVDAFRRFRGADLLLAGDGTERQALEQASQDQSHVHLLGRRSPSELAAYYRHAIATVVPSIGYETFGLTAAESCAAGTPIVVHDRGPLPELARDTGAGLCYRTPEELIARLERLVSDDALREKLARNAARAHQERWTRERHLDAYEGVVAELQRARSAGNGAEHA
jgi:glycosyltransferase involved in cell wall biosynthesis